MQSEAIKALNIKELLSSKDSYVIPIYQRNYAWEAKEIEQLIQDIIDYSIHHPNKNYYIGTLVVASESKNNTRYFSTIDGQQRLTTLTILSSVIKHKYQDIDLAWFNNLNLHYASREKSTLSINAAFNGVFEDKDYELNIEAAYKICSEELVKKTEENKISIAQFAEYLYKFVTILRVPLPDETDLNHYFEIMNSRGEQLEKHEILKAKLMECFNSFEKDKRNEYETCFNLIWEACSNMERYVQYGFTPNQRHIIFGENDWNNLIVYDFEDFIQKIKPHLVNSSETVDLSIDDILAQKAVITKSEDGELTPDRFNSVVNFQNFLLHVLRVQTAKNEVALDDKRLIELFDKEFPKKEDERIEFAKKFIYNLLKSKFLFDKYIIKREFTANTDRWSLKSLKWYSSGKVKNQAKYTNTFGEELNDSFDSDNRKILMLLSMFHVSIPSMAYKYWLNASLNYLFHQVDIDSKDYINYLEHIAKSFVFDRYLAKQPLDYFEMIYVNLNPIKRNLSQLDLDKLQYGRIENNLIFNFFDYLLWLKYKDIEKDNRVKSYEYTFRSSVEHYYPQTPINADIDTIEDTYLHSFGNLCLISHEKNSRLNNHSPSAKKDHYGKNTTIDSIKQFLMMTNQNWSIKEIDEHNNAMIDLLTVNLNSDFKLNGETTLAQKWFKEFKVKNPNLLVRVLLCFDDCTRHINGDRYNLLDFDYMRGHEAFKLFEKYIEEKSPKNINDIISKHLTLKNIKNDYCYLFIKYPELIEYCKEGNFIWHDDGKIIYLLEAEKATKNKSKEAYTFILAKYFKDLVNIQPYTDYEGIYLNIKYVDDKYQLVADRDDTDLQIEIWNNEGTSIDYRMLPIANGNTKAVKLLTEYKWEKNGEGYFVRLNNSKLISLGEDFDENILNLNEAISKLFKNGLGIKII